MSFEPASALTGASPAREEQPSPPRGRLAQSTLRWADANSHLDQRDRRLNQRDRRLNQRDLLMNEDNPVESDGSRATGPRPESHPGVRFGKIGVLLMNLGT